MYNLVSCTRYVQLQEEGELNIQKYTQGTE